MGGTHTIAQMHRRLEKRLIHELHTLSILQKRTKIPVLEVLTGGFVGIGDVMTMRNLQSSWIRAMDN